MTLTPRALRVSGGIFTDAPAAKGVEYGFLATLAASAATDGFLTLGRETANTFGLVEGEYAAATH